MSVQAVGMSKTRNKPAMASVVWGIIAVLLLRLGEGSIVLLGLGLFSCLVALWIGTRGIGTAKELSQKGRNWAFTGMIIGGIGLWVVVVLLFRMNLGSGPNSPARQHANLHGNIAQSAAISLISEAS